MVNLIRDRLRTFQEEQRKIENEKQEKLDSACAELERDLISIITSLSETASEKIQRREETIRRLEEEVRYLRELASSQRTMLDQNIEYLIEVESHQKKNSG